MYNDFGLSNNKNKTPNGQITQIRCAFRNLMHYTKEIKKKTNDE